MLKKLHTVQEVAEFLAMDEQTIWRMCRKEQIPHQKIGRAYRFSDADIEALLRKTRVEPKGNEGPVPVGRTR